MADKVAAALRERLGGEGASMKIDEAVSILRTYNEWRRSPAHYLESAAMPEMGDPKQIGIAIDTVCDALSKSGDWTRALRLADDAPLAYIARTKPHYEPTPNEGSEP